MAFQALRRSFREPSFEGLEPRQLLDGVTAEFSHAYTTPTALFIEVKYKADDAIDVATLSDDDIRVTRAAGLGPALTMAATLAGPPRTDWDGGTKVLYKVDAPDDFYGQWWFGTDNGAYTVSVEAGAVSGISGATNEAADLRTLNLWFNNLPRLEFGLQGMALTGVGYPPGPLSPDQASMDEARVTFWYRMANLGTPIRSVQVTLTGPNGYSRTVTTAPALTSFYVPDTTAMARMDVRFPVPKSDSDTSSSGTWDFSDAGLYNVTIRYAPTASDPNPSVVLEREFNVESNRPQGEIANIAVNADQMLVTMRYNSPQGMNLTSIGDGDIKAAMPGSGLVSGTLVGSPTVENGVVTATYRVNAPANGWASVPTGKVLVRTALDSVVDSNGNPVGFALSREVDVSSAGRVTGLVTDSYTTATKLIVTVRYSSDQTIDVATLGDDDVRLTGPWQYSKLGKLAEVVPQANGSVLAVYHFTSNSATGMWDFHIDNGTYVAALVADSVKEVGGTGGNSGETLRTYGLWFQTPVIAVQETVVPWIGTTLQDDMTTNTDSGRILIHYSTLNERRLSSHHMVLRVTGPNGFVGEIKQHIPPVSYRSMPPSGRENVITFEFAPPGGGWDYTDNGQYTIAIDLVPGTGFYALPGQPYRETVFTRQIDVNIARPRAEVTSTVITSNAMLVTVQYQSTAGINASTIGDGDVVLLKRVSNFVLGTTLETLVGTLVGSPTAGANGAMRATYRFVTAGGAPWSAFDATLAVRPQQVSDTAGNVVGAPMLHNFLMPSAQPDIVNVGTLTQSRAAWEVEVAFRNPGNLIQTSSIRPQNLIVTAPDGRATRISVVSVTVGLDGTLRARYRIMPQMGTLRLFDGTYTLALAGNSVSQGAAGYLRAQDLGSFNLVFP